MSVEAKMTLDASDYVAGLKQVEEAHDKHTKSSKETEEALQSLEKRLDETKEKFEQYAKSFEDAEKKHSEGSGIGAAFGVSESRVLRTLGNIQREAINTTSPIEAASGALGHLSHLLGDEFAEGAAGTLGLLTLVGNKMVELHEHTVEMTEAYENLSTVFKFGPEVEAEDMGSSTLGSKVNDAKGQIQKINESLNDPTIAASLERGWNRALYGISSAINPNLTGADPTYDQDMINRAKDIADKQAAANVELAHRANESAEIDVTTKKAQFSQDPYAKSQAQIKRIDFEYTNREKDAHDNQDFAGEAQLEKERDLKVEGIQIDQEHQNATREEDIRHQQALSTANTLKAEEAATVTRMRGDGQTFAAQDLEFANRKLDIERDTAEQIKSAQEKGKIDGTPQDKIDATVASIQAQGEAEKRQIDAQKDAAVTQRQWQTEHLEAELAIGNITGAIGERNLAMERAKLIELRRQHDQLSDNAKLQNEVSQAESKRALADTYQKRDVEFRQSGEHGTLSDIEEKYKNVNGQDLTQSPKAIRELTTAKENALIARSNDADVKGDPNAEIGVLNQMKSLRNSVNNPADLFAFDGTSQQSIGGGRSGATGGSSAELIRTQTGLLKEINGAIAVITSRIVQDQTISKGLR